MQKRKRKLVYRLASQLLIASLLAITLLSGLTGLMKPQKAGAEGDAVPEHTVVTAGQLAVWEIINNADPKSIKVWGGTLPNNLTTSGTNDVYQVHAWIHYANEADAQAGACQQAKARWAHRGSGDWFPNYPEFLNDQPFNGQCGSAPSAPPAGPPSQPNVPPGAIGTCDPNTGVMALTPGTWSPVNTALINREFNWTTHVVYIYTTPGIPTQLWVGSAASSNHDPLTERAVWIRCDGRSWDWILQDAMGEAARVAGGSLGFIPAGVLVNGMPFTGAPATGVVAPQQVPDGVTKIGRAHV